MSDEEKSLIISEPQEIEKIMSESLIDLKDSRVSRLTEKSLLKQVRVCPSPLIPKIMTVCIMRAVKEKIYGARPIHKIVETIEKTWRR